MMEQVRKSFIQLLDSAKWMNSSLKGSLRKKARTITPCIGFAPWMSPNGSEFDRHTFQEHLNNHFAGVTTHKIRQQIAPATCRSKLISRDCDNFRVYLLVCVKFDVCS